MPAKLTPYQEWKAAKIKERADRIDRMKTARELAKLPAARNRPGVRRKRCCGGYAG